MEGTQSPVAYPDAGIWFSHRVHGLTATGPILWEPPATQHPSGVTAYIKKELEHAAIIGPVQSYSFQWPRSNPMMTRPKKDSSVRRVFLSWTFLCPRAPVSTPESPRTPSTVLLSSSGSPIQPPWPTRSWSMAGTACSTKWTSAELTGSSGPTPWIGRSSCLNGTNSFSWTSPSLSAFDTELQPAKGLRKPSPPSLERRQELTPPPILMTPSGQPYYIQPGLITTTFWISWLSWAWMRPPTSAKAPPPSSSGLE